METLAIGRLNEIVVELSTKWGNLQKVRKLENFSILLKWDNLLSKIIPRSAYIKIYQLNVHSLIICPSKSNHICYSDHNQQELFYINWSSFMKLYLGQHNVAMYHSFKVSRKIEQHMAEVYSPGSKSYLFFILFRPYLFYPSFIRMSFVVVPVCIPRLNFDSKYIMEFE